MSKRRDAIETMYAFISEDETGEGVCGFVGPDGRWMPMVGADWKRVESLLPKAQQLANLSGRKIRLVKFTTRIELQVIEP